MNSKQKILWLAGFMLIGIAAGLLIIYVCIRCARDFCTDTLPDTPNIYVYSADLMYDELNRRYVESKGLSKGDGFRMIEYEDIPEIASLDGVKGFYIFDDVKLDEMLNYDLSGPLREWSVPQDIYLYFGDPSGESSMFIPVIGGGPADGTNGICLPQTEIAALLNPALGSTIEWNGGTYTLTGVNKNRFAWVAFDEDKSLYYVYDPATYDDFLTRLNLYCLREDAVSHVNMMIVCDEDKSVEIQDYLISTYPASNYSSREFARVFKSSYNAEIWKEILVFALLDLGITAVVVTPMLIKAKKKENS